MCFLKWKTDPVEFLFYIIVSLLLVLPVSSFAATTCTFTDSGSVRSLDADCTTDETILVPDGMTLDGQGNAITAEDPPAGHFVGAVVMNGGTEAHVTNLLVNTDNLANVCDGGDDRLRGIMFEGASGSISGNTISNVNQGASGCQEGNAIEVRNAPFDGTHPDTQTVEIEHNYVENYQKGGIICNGDVECHIHHNVVGESATQENLAANAVQLGFGASGEIAHNHIGGNQWLGASNYVATAVLIYSVDLVVVEKNNIGGNADVGIYVFSDDSTVDNNRVFESGEDGPHGDYGILNYGNGNEFTNNKVRGYETPTYGDTEGTKVIPRPQDPNACFQSCE